MHCIPDNVHSSPPGDDKSTAQNSSVKGWGTLGNFIFFLFLLSPVCAGNSPSCRSVLSVVHGSQNLYYLICFSLCYFFSDILFLHVREPYRKLYVQNHVASCNRCSHQGNHIEITCFFNFLITILG